jgi:exodeoxyribonuclease V beta subunit
LLGGLGLDSDAAAAEAAEPLDSTLVLALRQAVKLRSQGRRAADGAEPPLDPVERCKQKIDDALRDFDRAAIFTIHGFCARVLQDNAFRTGSAFEAELLKDARELIHDTLLDFWAREVTPLPLIVAEYLRRKAWVPSKLARPTQWLAQTWPLRVIPEVAGAAPSVDTSAFESAFEAARRSFDAHELVAFLEGANLHKGYYKPDKFVQWGEELSAYFNGMRASLIVPACLTKFRSETLAQARKKGSSSNWEGPGFIAKVDALWREITSLEEVLGEHFLRLRTRMIAWLQREVAEQKRAQRLVSFDDLLRQVGDALTAAGGSDLARSLEAQYPAALIDEFQDTDPVQYAIFDRIYQGSPAALFLIGDPKQAIYSFRGADVFAYLQAKTHVPTTAQYTMQTNHRSDTALVSAVNRLFSLTSYSFYLDGIQFVKVEAAKAGPSSLQLPSELGAAPFQVRFIARDSAPGGLSRQFKRRRLPELVANDVYSHLTSEATLDGRRLLPRDFAVLTRTNEEAFDCQRALLERGIPAVVLGDRSVYEQPEAADLFVLLKAISEPGNTRALRTALITETIGLDAHELLGLDHDESAWDQWVDRTRRWNERWFQFGFVQMMHHVLHDCRLPERLLALQDGERRMTNIMQVIELLHRQAVENHLGPSGVLHHLSQQLNGQFATADSEQVRLESDEDAVKLTTIHKSKGLEYPIVLCPTLHNGTLIFDSDKEWVRFHDPEDQHLLTLDLGSEQHDSHSELMKQEAMAENLRLLYVALTRAKHRTIVYWGAFYGFQNTGFQTSAFAYLIYAPTRGLGGGRPEMEAVASSVKQMDDGALVERLRSLDPSGEVIEVRLAALEAERPRYRAERVDQRKLVVRNLVRARPIWERTASFSALTAITKSDPLDGRDHDGPSLAAPLLVASDERVTTLVNLPGGVTTGNFFHTVLEHTDFRAPDHSQAVERALAEHGAIEGLALEDAKELLSRAIPEILQTRFSNIALKDIAPESRLNELEFYLPAPSLRDGVHLTRERLAAVFLEHPSREVPSDYSRSVSELEFTPLAGFLKGYIDLVFEHRRRFYVIDYKTNNLGPNYSDYAPAKLAPAMAKSHYILQYHLYCLAVHRYLAARLVDYDYERHFGGSYYLFLRGMHPSLGAETGVFFEKPPLARLHALSELFPARSAARKAPRRELQP